MSLLFFAIVSWAANDLTSGRHHTCAVQSGKVYCWGHGQFGQLGNGQLENKAHPSQVVGIPETVVSVASHSFHTCALTLSGHVYCWGYNRSGQLGYGRPVPDYGYPVLWPDASGQPRFVSPTARRLPLENIVDIAVSRGTTCALQNSGKVFCLGDGRNYQLGDKTSGPGNATSSPRLSHFIGQAPNANQVSRSWVSLEDGFCIKQSKHHLCFGLSVPELKAMPKKKISVSLTQLAAGDSHLCGTHNDGKLQCIGQGWYAQVGTEDNQDLPEWTHVPTPFLVKDVYARKKTTCLLDSHDKLYCFGLCLHGQCTQKFSWPTAASGQRDYLFTSRTPIAVKIPAVRSLAMGDTHICARVHTSDIYCWGQGLLGQNGNGTTRTLLTPNLVKF